MVRETLRILSYALADKPNFSMAFFNSLLPSLDPLAKPSNSKQMSHSKIRKHLYENTVDNVFGGGVLVVGIVHPSRPARNGLKKLETIYPYSRI